MVNKFNCFLILKEKYFRFLLLSKLIIYNKKSLKKRKIINFFILNLSFIASILIKNIRKERKKDFFLTNIFIFQ